MKDKQQVLDGILECGIVAVVRGTSDELIMKAIEAALDGGINVIEVAFTVPNALEIIKRLAASVSDDVILGAGTVLTPEMAADAVDASAQFIVSPNVNLATIEMAKSRGVPVFPGALTPTEIITAWQAGADMVKIFPANVMGPAYLKDLHGPFPQIKFMPTGGVNLSTARDYLENGAAALGVGGDLINRKLMEEGNFAEITNRARKFRDIVREFRSGYGGGTWHR
ncbi:MAG TPA: bifunctional 4-hydroxy-2-oxoglutarate aldolase/2-dehydro-3-deoxy-phosphogluconate aldolase [Armatimonadota bacterium]|nr:bifunctional 4-hydroxy-2-oxoglutarate aldolase/2-dehydro-3-deoxy-phosphogluconate aldolase [Armatimonadota bacterium]